MSASRPSKDLCAAAKDHNVQPQKMAKRWGRCPGTPHAGGDRHDGYAVALCTRTLSEQRARRSTAYRGQKVETPESPSAQPWRATLPVPKNEPGTDTGCNTDRPYTHSAQWISHTPEGKHCLISFYEMPGTGEPRPIKIRLVAARDWGQGEVGPATGQAAPLNRGGVFFRAMKMVWN